MGFQAEGEGSVNVCVEVYREVVRRAVQSVKTRTVRLPRNLFASMTDDEISWLRNVTGVLVSVDDELRTPVFSESVES